MRLDRQCVSLQSIQHVGRILPGIALLVVTALACLYPAWRAASIDPMTAIRTE